MPYLKLWHGRETVDEEMDSWGTSGPVFGPFPFFHMTYDCEITFSEENGHILKVIDELVYYDGVYYGDWSFFDELDDGLRQRLIPFDPHKARPPIESA